MTTLTLVRRIAARPATVYAALTRPEAIVHWWGPDGGPVLQATTDVRVGGEFRVRFCTENGDEHECFGTYLVVEPDQKLAFTWHWRSAPAEQSEVTIALRAIDIGTELTFTHALLPDESARISHTRGWTGTLDKLQRYLASPRQGDPDE